MWYFWLTLQLIKQINTTEIFRCLNDAGKFYVVPLFLDIKDKVKDIFRDKVNDVFFKNYSEIDIWFLYISYWGESEAATRGVL